MPAKPVPAKPVVPAPPPPRRVRKPQFTIFALMVLTFVAAIGFAPLSYMMRADKDSSAWPIATLMAVATPMLLMIVLSLGYSLRRWLRRRR
jgi:hypothetical protein